VQQQRCPARGVWRSVPPREPAAASAARRARLLAAGARAHASPPGPQLDIVKQDCGRLANENSALHAQLIQSAERGDALQVRPAARGLQALP
jgi:hypothetical protein